MSSLASTIRGRVWKFGDSVDTNQLAGGGIRGSTLGETLRLNCLRGLRPEFAEHVKPGDIVVAGSNFGCGSSRQTAVEALELCGVAAVLAESIARIHRRNSIALAFPAFTVPGITDGVQDGDEIEIDYRGGVVRSITRDFQTPLPKLPPSVEQIYEAGGIMQVIARRLADQGVIPT